MKKPPLSKDTVCCISIAAIPGNFGSSLFNPAFELLGIDFIYKPFKVSATDLPAAVAAVRSLGIRGCGVSMPHKTAVMAHLDVIDKTARQVGAVNTVVNKNGKLFGYNTDTIGAGTALTRLYPMAGKTAHVMGSGGAARAILAALKKARCKKIYVSGRSITAKKLADEFKVTYWPAKELGRLKADLFVNATPVGMAPRKEQMIIKENELNRYRAVMDVVVTPLHTSLIRTAKGRGLAVIPGFEMSLYQAAAQFTLYTGRPAPVAFMRKTLTKTLIKKS